MMVRRLDSAEEDMVPLNNGLHDYGEGPLSPVAGGFSSGRRSPFSDKLKQVASTIGRGITLSSGTPKYQKVGLIEGH